MADEGFNLYECICNHELATQQLLSILRQNQNYCTDNECFNLPQQPGPHNVPSSTNFLMTCLIIAFILIMYALRPNSLRQVQQDNVKDRDNERHSDDEPPAPPPMA
ncbi:PREDICTED: small integral membrane protein 14 isoform X2 [Dufourea novaeangliae]|nr:PREDICTED: small integral membrane protein 14 isoform X2 [Dufourea novaeangliae]XP_015435887.1 PREDICTED: small integral membrane protein 14 isoform X2 [Dufourea novaeangliae]